MILVFASPLVTVRFLALEVAMQDLCAHRTKSARVSICPSFSLHIGHLFHHIPDHGMQAFEQVPWTPGNLSRWVCGTLRDVPAVQFCERKHETACHLWIASFADHGGFVNYSIFPDTRAFLPGAVCIWCSGWSLPCWLFFEESQVENLSLLEEHGTS